MRTIKKIAGIVGVVGSFLPSYAYANEVKEAGSHTPITTISSDKKEEAATHMARAKELSTTNRFLATKFPLSSANPELHVEKARMLLSKADK